MKRRAFIVLIGGMAVWSLTARAQQGQQVRRIGALMNLVADDAAGKVELAAFQNSLQKLGWSDGGNVRIDVRWGANDVDLAAATRRN